MRLKWRRVGDTRTQWAWRTMTSQQDGNLWVLIGRSIQGFVSPSRVHSSSAPLSHHRGTHYLWGESFHFQANPYASPSAGLKFDFLCPPGSPQDKPSHWIACQHCSSSRINLPYFFTLPHGTGFSDPSLELPSPDFLQENNGSQDLAVTWPTGFLLGAPSA